MDSTIIFNTGLPILNEVINVFLVNAPQITISAILITIYAIIIWHYYRTMAKRDFFITNKKEGKGIFVGIHNFISEFGTIAKYIFIYPIISFSFFAIFSILLFFLSREQPIATILFIAAAYISAIRITAHYSEDLSKDLAKMIPFALLGVLIVDINFFSTTLFIERLQSLPNFILNIISFILYFLVLELVLKIIYRIKLFFFGKTETIEKK